MGENQPPPPESSAAQPSTVELYPGYAEELKRKRERDANIAHAGATPLPGPLAEAFASGPVKIGDYTIREFVPMDAAILRRLNSPFYQQIIETLKPKEERRPTPTEDSDEWVVIFLFTRSCLEAERVLDLGVAEFQRQARAAFAHNPRLNLALYNDLYQACAARVVRAFSTALHYRASTPEADSTVFTTPPAEPTTASVGGSTTSAAS